MRDEKQMSVGSAGTRRPSIISSELQPGEERELVWELNADKDFVLEWDLELGRPPESQMMVTEARIEII